MEKLKKIANFNSHKTKDLWEKISKHVNKKFNDVDISKALKSLNEKINSYEISSQKTMNPNEKRKLLIFEIFLKSGKKNNLPIVLDIFSKAFDDVQPLIIISYYLNTFSIFIKAKCLKNEILKKNIKKHSIKTDFYSNDEKEIFLNFDNVNMNSIFDMFDEICRKIVYQEFTKKFDFNTNVTWEIIDFLYEIGKKDKETKKLVRKMNKTYDDYEKLLLLRQIKKLKEEKIEIEEQIDKKLYK